MPAIKLKQKLCKKCKKKKYIFSKGRCETCTPRKPIKRTPIKRNKTTKQKRIKPLSKKRQIEAAKYRFIRITFLIIFPTCEAKLRDYEIISTEIHHKAGRTGKLFLDTTKWLPVCQNCYKWIELNPKKAKELNLSENRLKATK